MSFLERHREASRRRRARKEARSLVREVRRAVRKHGSQVPAEPRQELEAGVASVEDALARGDHDATCAAMVKLDEHVDKHLPFARKSTFREYAESIAVAVLIALFLRAFVVEAFKIPSSSMIPTMEVGDHIFVNKFIYGLRIPFTKVRFFDFRKPRRGEVVVFIYPQDEDKDFIKRIVGVEGDQIAVRRNVLYVNGQVVSRRPIEGYCGYLDYDEADRMWRRRACLRVEETLDGIRYATVYDPASGSRDFPSDEFHDDDGDDDGGDGDAPYVVPPGHVFVMGDNRNNSHDSRFWGPVPFENIKGKALVIWWSSGSPEGIRWDRLGKLVD